ncbi:MarR family transcriptional regulator [bacterium]|nr:MarR family transcriptional regulator [bacterium]
MEKNENIGKLFSILHRQGQMFFQKAFEDDEIGGGQIFFLLHLIFKKGINQKTLAEEMFVDKGTAARAVDHLIQAGLIRRQPDPEDGRAYQLYPTEKAFSFYKTFELRANEWEQILTKGLSDKMIVELKSVINKIVDNVQNYRNSQK